MRIAISGAGIAGPTLAWWLREGGHEPFLIEKAPEFRDGGYVIDFWGLGYHLAERMDLLPRILERGYQVEEIRAVGPDGQRIAGFSADIFHRMTDGRFTSLPRGDLARTIYEAVEQDVETLFDETISAIEQDGTGVRFALQGGGDREADLLIGADGLHSRVRALAFGTDAEFERKLGYHVAAFTVEGYRPRDPDVYVTRSWPGRTLARFALRDGSTLVMMVVAEEYLPDHGEGASEQALQRLLSGLDWEAAAMREAMADANDLYFDRVSQIEMPRWSQGRVGLVGDAAACVSLLAGEGAGLGMVEAYVMAAELARADGDHSIAFPAYERRLRRFIEDKQKSARAFAGSFAPRSHIGIATRNLAVRLMRFPALARFLLGNTLQDDFELPCFASVERGW